MLSTTIEVFAFMIFFAIAIALLAVFVDTLCSYSQYVCELASVKQLIGLLFKIMLAFLIAAIVYFVLAFILEYNYRKDRDYVYLQGYM